jgi:type I restriction enzyme S subunit
MHVCLGQRLVQVRARDSLVKPEYLLAVLLSALRPSHIASTMVGSAAQHLNVSDLRALAIPLAPLDEQQRFAARIAALSVQRAAADRALGVHEELFESVLSQSFRKV